MNSLDIENFGDRLKESIKEAKTNQKDLAAAIRLSTTSINNYTSGKRIPDADSLYKICAHINTNMEWLLTGKGAKRPDEKNYLSKDEEEMLEVYNRLSYEEKIIIKGKIFELLSTRK